MKSTLLKTPLVGLFAFALTTVSAQANPFFESSDDAPAYSQSQAHELEQLRRDLETQRAELLKIRDEIMGSKVDAGTSGKPMADIDSAAPEVADTDESKPDDTEATPAIPNHFQSFMVINGEYVLKNMGNAGPPYLTVDQATYNDRMMSRTNGRMTSTGTSNTDLADTNAEESIDD